jgi:hypothetical protein
MSNKSTHDDRYSVEGSVFDVKDFLGDRLRVRVGPVFTETFPSGHPEMGIWLEMGDNEVLMSYATFISLNDHIHHNFDEWKKFKSTLEKADL